MDIKQIDLDGFWNLIKQYENEEFRTTTGLPFTYKVCRDSVSISRTKYYMPTKLDFEKAIRINPSVVTDLQNEVGGPSYVFAIIKDERIKQFFANEKKEEKVSKKKQWKSIWEKVVDANCVMISDFNEGKKLFKSLIAKYPDDGMVYYEYAEAFEYYKKYEEALENYEKAEVHFPRDEWKNIAKAGMERAKYPSKELSTSFETIYHKIHLIKNLYPTLKYMVLFSMAKSLDDKTLCLVAARTSLEAVVYDYSYPNQEIPEEINLNDEINKIKNKINEKIIAKMHNIRLAGNSVVHLRPKQSAKDASSDLSARMFDLYDIIEEFYS